MVVVVVVVVIVVAIMTHNQRTTTSVQVQMAGRTILDCILRKLPSSRKRYRVTLIVPDNGIPIIEYHQASTSKKPKKSISFVDLLFADKKHDTNEKFAFSIYTPDKTITFLAKDETTMNEWLTKIRECHLYLDSKRYDVIFEANLLDKGLANTMHIPGPYRVALCKESLDLIPLSTAPHLLLKQQELLLQQQSTNATSTATPPTTKPHNTSSTLHNTPNQNNHQQHHKSQNMNESKLPNTIHHHHPHIHTTNPNTANINPQANHLHVPQHLPPHQRFDKQHPLLKANTIELVLRSIRRCGHTDCNFYLESGRHSQIGEGDLWMALNKKSTARQLHELLLATMKLTSQQEDSFLYKAPRSRSGSSSENAHRSQQSRSSSLVCLASETTTTTTPSMSNNIAINTNNNNNSGNKTTTNNDNIDEDSGYLPMA